MATKIEPKKDLKYYLSLNWSYTIEQDSHNGKKFWIIRVNELPGVCTDALTISKGMENIKEAIAGAIELYLEQGDPIKFDTGVEQLRAY